jgi:hypothetical protein
MRRIFIVSRFLANFGLSKASDASRNQNGQQKKFHPGTLFYGKRGWNQVLKEKERSYGMQNRKSTISRLNISKRLGQSRQLCKKLRNFAADLQQKDFKQDGNNNIKYN